MSVLVLKSDKDNDYYVEVDGVIRGHFHSLADVESARKEKRWGKAAKSQSLLDYTIIKELHLD